MMQRKKQAAAAAAKEKEDARTRERRALAAEQAQQAAAAAEQSDEQARHRQFLAGKAHVALRVRPPFLGHMCVCTAALPAAAVAAEHSVFSTVAGGPY